MFWLFTQMFVLCAVSFAAGSALTWWSHRGRVQPEAPRMPLALPAPRPSAEKPTPMVNVWQLKGNSKTMVYHTPDSPYYRRMKGDMTFATEDEALAAGYRMWTTKARAKA